MIFGSTFGIGPRRVGNEPKKDWTRKRILNQKRILNGFWIEILFFARGGVAGIWIKKESLGPGNDPGFCSKMKTCTRFLPFSNDSWVPGRALTMCRSEPGSGSQVESKKEFESKKDSEPKKNSEPKKDSLNGEFFFERKYFFLTILESERRTKFLNENFFKNLFLRRRPEMNE